MFYQIKYIHGVLDDVIVSAGFEFLELPADSARYELSPDGLVNSTVGFVEVVPNVIDSFQDPLHVLFVGSSAPVKVQQGDQWRLILAGMS